MLSTTFVVRSVNGNLLGREMNASDIERKWLYRVRQVSTLLLFTADDALALLNDCVGSDVLFLGVEGFRLLADGRVQPAMEFSNVSFGKVPRHAGEPEFEFKRGLRQPWVADIDALEKTKALITEGSANGYDWYEVSLEDPVTGELLFFRAVES
jgi:hypothetical protein